MTRSLVSLFCLAIALPLLQVGCGGGKGQSGGSGGGGGASVDAEIKTLCDKGCQCAQCAPTRSGPSWTGRGCW